MSQEISSSWRGVLIQRRSSRAARRAGTSASGCPSENSQGIEGREVADVLARGHEDAAEDAVDFAARIGDAGNDNRDPGSWILKQQITSPRSAGGNFVPPIISDDPGAVGSLLGRQRLGSGIREGDATGFQGGKKIALGWRDAIEADEEDFGWQR